MHKFINSLFALVAIAPCAAHPGGLDSKGGHNDRKNGGYHYHRGSSTATPAPNSPLTQPKKAATTTTNRSESKSSYGPPLQRGAIVLNVAAEQIVRSESQWETSWGEFSRDYINARVLVIDLRQLGPGNPNVKVEWFFIGRDYDKEHLFIYDPGETTGNIGRGGIKLIYVKGTRL